MLRGVRGATTVDEDDPRQIAERTSELVRILVESNGIRAEDVASAVFTATHDVAAAFPAVAARTVPGWEAVPLLCAREIPVPGALGRCIRVLIHWNTELPASAVRHAFLRGARILRPEWAVPPAESGESGP
ncbi:MAG TPA: chorismate mutase [Thermoanaerobaculia bacterium]|nr:chorismate mutase [Thermoanaerobaculia bacterium]